MAPHLVHRVLARDLAANLGVEVLRAGAGALAGHGEAVLQAQHAECQKAQRFEVGIGNKRLFTAFIGSGFNGTIATVGGCDRPIK